MAICSAIGEKEKREKRKKEKKKKRKRKRKKENERGNFFSRYERERDQRKIELGFFFSVIQTNQLTNVSHHQLRIHDSTR